MGIHESSTKRKIICKCLNNLEKSHTSNLTAHLKALDQKEETHPGGVGHNPTQGWNQQNRNRTIQKIKDTKSWFFDKTSKIDKPLPKQTKRHRENRKWQN